MPSQISNKLLISHLMDTQTTMCTLQPFGSSQQTLFNWWGDLLDLENAISNEQQAVDLTSVGHPDHWLRLSTLGSSQHTRYDRSGDLSDLKEVLDMDIIDWHVTLSNMYGSNRDAKAWIGYKKISLELYNIVFAKLVSTDANKIGVFPGILFRCPFPGQSFNCCRFPILELLPLAAHEFEQFWILKRIAENKILLVYSCGWGPVHY
jgi:hypothetical protein